MDLLRLHSSFRLVAEVVLVIVLFSLIGFLCWENRESRILKSRIRDLEVQLAEGIQRVDTFTIRDSVPVFRERIVEVDRTDYKKQLADRDLIRDLELRMGQIEAENRMLRSTRDTVVLSAVNDSLYRYSDKWVTFEYRTVPRLLDYAVRDSLTTIISREYKHKFLWWRWGTKGYSLYIVNHNPHSSVEYNKYISIKK